MSEMGRQIDEVVRLAEVCDAEGIMMALRGLCRSISLGGKIAGRGSGQKSEDRDSPVRAAFQPRSFDFNDFNGGT